MRRLPLVSMAALGLAIGPPTLAQQLQPEPTAPTAPPKPIPEQVEDQALATNLLGTSVSNGYDTIGEVSDLVVTKDGRV